MCVPTMNLSTPLPAQYPLLHQPLAVHEQFGSYFFPKTLSVLATTLSRKMEEGHICLHKEDAFADETDGRTAPISELWDAFIAHPWVGNESQTNKPFIIEDNRLYLQRYFQYETRILERLHQFVDSSRSHAPKRWEQLLAQSTSIRELFPASRSTDSVSAPNWQEMAALMAYVQDFFILTGGPGTGKTTTVAKLLALLWLTDPSLRIALAAPTGKAAARMAESLRQTRLNLPPVIQENMERLEPATLHRLLGYMPHSIFFKHHAQNPLPFDVVIVDESSMMDVALMSKLMDAIGPYTKLILLGDKNQLASVEAGSIFSDLCNAQTKLNPIPHNWRAYWEKLHPDQGAADSILFTETNHALDGHIIELQVSHRFQADAGIGKLATLVIQGDEPGCRHFLQQPHTDIQFSENDSLKSIQPFIAAYTNYIQEPDIQKAIQLFQQQRILCAVREGPFGVDAVNAWIENQLQQQKKIQKKEIFYENRPVMVTKNYYDLQLFNGDIGLVRRDAEGQLRVWFETKSGELRQVPPAFLDRVETAYAMTVHKSQGSEFDAVAVVLPPQADLPILTRELLYTAITRAKKSVHILASELSISACVNRKVERVSGIADRL